MEVARSESGDEQDPPTQNDNSQLDSPELGPRPKRQRHPPILLTYNTLNNPTYETQAATHVISTNSGKSVTSVPYCSYYLLCRFTIYTPVPATYKPVSVSASSDLSLPKHVSHHHQVSPSAVSRVTGKCIGSSFGWYTTGWYANYGLPGWKTGWGINGNMYLQYSLTPHPVFHPGSQYSAYQPVVYQPKDDPMHIPVTLDYGHVPVPGYVY